MSKMMGEHIPQMIASKMANMFEPFFNHFLDVAARSIEEDNLRSPRCSTRKLVSTRCWSHAASITARV